MAELRLGSCSTSPAIWERRLCSGELGWLLRTASEPLGSNDSLCGKGCGEEDATLPVRTFLLRNGGVLA